MRELCELNYHFFPRCSVKCKVLFSFSAISSVPFQRNQNVKCRVCSYQLMLHNVHQSLWGFGFPFHSMTRRVYSVYHLRTRCKGWEQIFTFIWNDFDMLVETYDVTQLAQKPSIKGITDLVEKRERGRERRVEQWNQWKWRTTQAKECRRERKGEKGTNEKNNGGNKIGREDKIRQSKRKRSNTSK